MTQPVSTNISTTVRTNNAVRKALKQTKGALQATQALSPELAARLSARTFFRTTRRALDPAERTLLDRGQPIVVDGAIGPISAWRWGTGPLVLLMHGWNGTASQLGGFVDPLTRAGFSVVAFDAPGHGDSAGSEASIADFADAFEGVTNAVRPLFQPIHAIVAHSLGAPATLLALSRARAGGAEAPLRTEGLERTRVVFVAPPIDMLVTVRSFSSAMGLGGGTHSAFERAVIQRVGARFDAAYTLGLAAEMRSPLLVVHDELDRTVPIDSGRRLAAAWPGAEFRSTLGLGHNRILNDEGTVQTAVEFIRR